MILLYVISSINLIMSDLSNCRELFIGKKLVAYSKLLIGKDEGYVLIFENGQGLNESTGEPIGLDSIIEAIALTRKKYDQRIEKAQGRLSELEYTREILIKIRKGV
jgi:hypothetical protein